MCGASGAFKIRFVKINHPGRRMGSGDGSGLQNFMIQCDGQFLFDQPGANEQQKFAGNGSRLADGLASNRIHNWIIGQLNVLDDEPAMKPEVFELFEVNHISIQTPSCSWRPSELPSSRIAASLSSTWRSA